MMKEEPHYIISEDEIEKVNKTLDAVAVRIPPEQLSEVRQMNRRQRKRWLEKNGVTLTEYRNQEGSESSR